MRINGQMSESILVMLFITVSGGLQDAYTYLIRDGVFANAQTGNIVLLSHHLFGGRISQTLRYLVPLLAFACGVAAAEQIRARFKDWQALHWRQLIVLLEIALLFAVGFLPESMNPLANALVSFSCAMQVQTFRKVKGYAYASTMCIGNMRSGMEALSVWLRTGDADSLGKAGQYFQVIVLFALGAGMGSAMAGILGRYTIWISCVLLLAGFCVMFIKEKTKESQMEVK